MINIAERPARPKAISIYRPMTLTPARRPTLCRVLAALQIVVAAALTWSHLGHLDPPNPPARPGRSTSRTSSAGGA
jgi:hypothetical protein